jgi:deazaflavin-dependent oxidoreductase (nitroreductase family)
VPNDNVKVIAALRKGDAATDEEWEATGTTVPRDELLIVYTIGAKTGIERLIPLRYHRDGERWIVFASNSGSPTDPDWFRNLMAHPETKIEVDGEIIPVIVTVASGAERARIWANHIARYPHFEEYAARAGREVPVVVLTRTS